jgi:hypothetical protein
MTQQRWQRLEALFETANALDRVARCAFLERECHGDPSLGAEAA